MGGATSKLDKDVADGNMVIKIQNTKKVLVMTLLLLLPHLRIDDGEYDAEHDEIGVE